MTREEAIKTLNGEAWSFGSKEYQEAFDMAIKVLKQDTDKEKVIEELQESLQKANATNTTLINLLEGKRKAGKWLVNKEKDMVCCPFCMDKQKIGEAEVRLLDTAFAGFRFCRYCGAMMVGGEDEGHQD